MMRKSSQVRRPGFSLPEILVVVAIIGVLAALSFVGYSYATRPATKYLAMAKAAKAQVEKSQADLEKKAPLKAAAANPAAPTPRPASANPGDYGAVPNEYVVAFASNVQDPSLEAVRLAAKHQGRVLKVFKRIQKAAAFHIPADEVAAFRQDPAIGVIEPNLIGKIAVETTPTGVRRMFSYPSIPSNQLVLRKPAPRSNGRNIMFGPNSPIGAAAVNVAVIDSGIDPTHPDLNVVVNQPFAGYPAIDENGHGTHVAGSIGARSHNGQGVVGAYPGAALWSLRITDAPGSYTNVTLLEALAYVYDNAHRIKVCNMSIGGPASKIVNDFVDAVAARGVVMVAAAGNSAKAASGFSPASASRAICVAALADSDGLPGKKGKKTSAGNDDTFATFSNFGPAVHVIAPGVDILSTFPNNSYGVLSGTSMACPHVAGMCALLLDPQTVFGTNNRNLFLNHRPSVVNATYLRSIATELIPGIGGDPIQYPLVNFKVQ